MLLRHWQKLLAGLGLAALYFVLGVNTDTQYGDPDRYFHISLSRWAWEQGDWAPKTFPFLEGIGWHRFFPDKEVLFHFFTFLGYGLYGERGVYLAALGIALTMLVVFYLYAASKLPAWLAAAVTFTVLFSPVVFFRFQLIRAFVLGSLTLLVLHLGVVSRNRWLAAGGAFAFGLAYHAYYIPLVCLGAATLLGALEAERDFQSKKYVLLFGVIGLLAGIFLNPYFPGNLVVGYQHALVPSLMQGDLSKIGFGAELYPSRSNVLLSSLAPFLAITLAGLLALGRMGLQEIRGRFHFQVYYLVATSLFFLGLTFLSPRASEYLVPASGLLLVTLLSRVKQWNGMATLGVTAVVLVTALQLGEQYRREISNEPGDREKQVGAALAELPRGLDRPFIFNCEWDMSPYIIYHYPGARVVDILDPSFLYFHDRGKFRARQEFIDGNAADSHGLMRNGFKADYVLCARPRPMAKMLFDPGFQLVYPRMENKPEPGPLNITLFKVLKEDVPQYARDWTVQWLPGVTTANFLGFDPSSKGTAERKIKLPNGTVVNFSQVFAEERLQDESDPETAAYCAIASPARSELARLAGARYLVLGGGRNIRLWRNGLLLFQSQEAFPSAASAHTVIPLGQPLASHDELTAIVCSKRDASYWALALSFWTEDAFREKCRWKKELVKSNPGPGGGSAGHFINQVQETCLGEMAAPPLAPRLRAIRQSLRVEGKNR